MVKVFLLFILYFCLHISFLHGFDFIDKKGRSFTGEILETKGSKFHIKRTDGKTFWIESSILSANTLNSIKALAESTNVNPISFQKINDTLGIPLLNSQNLWNSSFEDLYNRLRWPLESATETGFSCRLYPSSDYSIFGARPYSCALYATKEHPELFSIVFANKGDLADSNGHLISDPDVTSPDKVKRAIKRLIDDEAEKIEKTLTEILGEPERAVIGDKQLKEKALRWDWGEHAFLLSIQDDEYVGLRIATKAYADNRGMSAKITDKDIRQLIKQNVVRKENGDVLIKNIPMVSQGPKGYCAPATFERYMRYMGISADMYVLAMAANTKIGGGTYVSSLIDGVKTYVARNGRKLKSVKSKIDMRNISKYIDDGYPIAWTMFSTANYNALANHHTAARAKRTDWKTWKAYTKKERKEFDLVPDRESGHVCMIIGYNKDTDEIAVSDSWGPEYEIRWIHVEHAEQVSQGSLLIISS